MVKDLPHSSADEAVDALHETVGQRLFQYRTEANLSQKQLAKRSKVSNAFISRLEDPSQKYSPHLDKLILVAQALDRPLTDFFQRAAEDESPAAADAVVTPSKAFVFD